MQNKSAGIPSATGTDVLADTTVAAWLEANLTREEKSAFLALFGGARTNLKCFVRGDTGEEHACFGKAECERVPFRATWQHKFPALCLTTFEESEQRPALGMVAGSTRTKITIGVTDFGWVVQEAFWRHVNGNAEARSHD